MPLTNIPFSLGRSNVKAREYAAAGVPWLASPVGSYVDLGGDQGGWLVEDDKWFEAMDALIRAGRERQAGQARQGVGEGRDDLEHGWRAAVPRRAPP